jgi:hypothetical protein
MLSFHRQRAHFPLLHLRAYLMKKFLLNFLIRRWKSCRHNFNITFLKKISHHDKSFWSTCTTTCFLKGFWFWHITPCSPLKVNRLYGGIQVYRLHLQDRTISQERREHTEVSKHISVDFQRTTWRYTTEDWTLHNHSSQNLRPCIHICCLLTESMTELFQADSNEGKISYMK